MRAFYFSCICAMICAFPARGQQYFNNVSLDNTHGATMLCFTVPHETNIKYYRVEGSNDNIIFDIIGTIRSTGNSMLSKSYRNALNDATYKYYRIGIVGMNASLFYSSVITAHNSKPITKPPDIPNDATIVNMH